MGDPKSEQGLEIRPAPLTSFNVQFNIFLGVPPALLSFLLISGIHSFSFLYYSINLLQTSSSEYKSALPSSSDKYIFSRVIAIASFFFCVIILPNYSMMSPQMSISLRSILAVHLALVCLLPNAVTAIATVMALQAHGHGYN